ncbi:MAG: glycosyltransferase family 2 protein, partial [Candidatus Krumholzibacteria bacterium]|nr:glycosyltransferase family 2 protein [Candidatus Krumholzibacteria bacterium]
MTHPDFSVVVPCYNEESAIAHTLDTLEQALEGAGPHEIIVVDDGSRDRTAEVLRESAAGHADLRVVAHRKNQGYGAALKTGIRRASGELVVIIDADGTYPVGRVPDLVREARDADMVVGARTGENVTYSFIRKIPKVFLKAYMSWLAGEEIPDMNSGLRVFRRASVERFLNILPDTFSFTTTVTLAMLRNRYDVRFVPIDYAGRIGKSKIKPVRDTIRFTQLIVRTGMYFAPLRVLLPVAGFLFLLFC